MIRSKEPWISQGKKGLQEIESFGRIGPDQPMPGKVPGRKVPGVELGELTYVEGDTLRRFRPADNVTFCDGVLAGVLCYYVVGNVQD